MKSLRRRLFGSHLLVMAVALLVLLAGAGLVVIAFEIFGERNLFGRKGGDEGGPLGLLFGLGAAVAASAIVSWRISRRLADPLSEIRDATQALAAGRYDVRLPSSDTIELDALAIDVNQLAHELETTEQRRLRLIGDVAHELRNPLSTIEGTMEALLDGVMPAEPDTYARIGREAARLRRLADDLSSLSAAGEFAVVAGDTVDLAEVVADVVAQLEPQARAKGLTLSASQTSTPAIPGDRDRLAQVVMNVVGNAVQYSDQGEVTVSTVVAADAIQIDVHDAGRGLSVEDQTRIFERFHRVDEHFSDGTGVGLAIAKLIVDAHGGTITAHSAGLGQGTHVEIRIPVGG